VNHDWRNPERVVPWKPRHRFRVTSVGEEAARTYRETIAAAQRADDARAALERAKQEWAAAHGVRTGDGILLEDMAAGATCLADLQPTLEACDLSLREARGVMDRLVAARLIESLEPAGTVAPWRSGPPGSY
jgi:hypothetical protein